MKLYLFGGAETDQRQAPILKNLINNVIADIKPKQLLHIPYARIEVPEEEKDIWGEGWVSRDLDLDGIELLDATDKDDLSKANNPTIFINGGPQRDQLYEKIISDKRLYDLVMNAEYIIGESAGSAVTAEYRRSFLNNKVVIKKGLGILKDTIIKAHYVARKRQQNLKDERKMANAIYGIGIDSISGIIIDTKTYPDKYETIGEGLVEIIKNTN